ncbi:hypothetical protein H9L39_02495 [Fusarium oxysporum f. sp. albedinis]|nr:hypothetical protein H9L39_02495 [Fusarium oxysporum f. sp. albedinis]
MSRFGLGVVVFDIEGLGDDCTVEGSVQFDPMDSFGIDYMHSFAAERLISLTPPPSVPDGIPFHFANIHHIEQNHFKP